MTVPHSGAPLRHVTVAAATVARTTKRGPSVGSCRARSSCGGACPTPTGATPSLVARRFLDRRPAADRAEVAGALLHDVGKVEAALGTFGRVAATIVGPRTERFRTYHDHEAIGARLAAAAGSDAVTVALIEGRGPAAEDLRTADQV